MLFSYYHCSDRQPENKPELAFAFSSPPVCGGGGGGGGAGEAAGLAQSARSDKKGKEGETDSSHSHPLHGFV